MSASWLADKIEQWPTTKLLPYPSFATVSHNLCFFGV